MRPVGPSDEPGGGSRSLRLPHLIAPDEVDAWLADSVVKTVTYHRTTRQAAEAILEYGVDLEKSRGGTYGKGFYTTTSTEGLPGDTTITLAVRTVNPLAGHANEVGDLVDELADDLGYTRLTASAAASVRNRLLELGYDGILARDAGGDGIDYVVVIKDGTVKVVIEG